MEADLQKKLNEIRISWPSEDLHIDNPTQFRFIGNGHQGVVFQIDEQKCVKIYFDEIDLNRELYALKLGEKAGICPKVYFWGDNYIVMEYFGGPTLFEYLQQHPLTKKLTKKIIVLLNQFEKVGYNRLDHSARHIYVVPKDKMKIIDVVRVINNQPIYFAERLLGDMGKYADDFIQYVREISPKWHRRWVNHPQFETVMEKARQKS